MIRTAWTRARDSELVERNWPSWCHDQAVNDQMNEQADEQADGRRRHSVRTVLIIATMVLAGLLLIDMAVVFLYPWFVALG